MSLGDDTVHVYNLSRDGNNVESIISGAGLNATKTSIGSILVGEGFDNDVNITCLVGNSSVVSSNRTAYVYFRSGELLLAVDIDMLALSMFLGSKKL